MHTYYTVSNLIDAKNLKQINLLGIIENESTSLIQNTMYFFCKEDKVLLPISFNGKTGDTAIIPSKEYLTLNPDIYTLIRNLLVLFKAQLSKIIVSYRSDDAYYAYLEVEQDTNKFHLLLNIEDSITLALKHKLKIFIPTHLLYENGVKITRELLESYLK